MALHRTLTAADGIHIIQSYEYADQTERLAASGFVAGDVGKVAKQASDETFWVLTSYSPITWAGLAGPGTITPHASTHKGDGSDAIAVVTTTVAGLMSAPDKVLLDGLVVGNVSQPVRNETGGTLLKGRAVIAIGWSVPENRSLVDYADKDDPDLCPAIGVLSADLPDTTNGSALVQGLLEGVDTSTFNLTAQLVLGTAGVLTLSPPDNTPFTGYLQNLGTVTKVDASDGHIRIVVEGLNPITADQLFALTGTGSPGPSNPYVTDDDSRMSDARAPTAHASNHQNGGSDEVATAIAAANAIPKAGSGSKLDVGWLPTGSTSTTVCIGNDSRLSDARTPTAHASSHEPSGSDAMIVDAAAATGSLRTIGTGSLQACAGDDSRLSDARTPTAHASSHAAGGTDALSPKEYGPLAADPSSPSPADGDSYFNTVLHEAMRYDGSRSKWLSVKALTYLAGRNGNTATGSFYRGVDGLSFGTNIGYEVPKGTLVGLSWARTDADAATLEVLVGGSVIATLASSSAGAVSDWTKNADFSAGLLQFRNASAGNTTSNVQITAFIKRRV